MRKSASNTAVASVGGHLPSLHGKDRPVSAANLRDAHRRNDRSDTEPALTGTRTTKKRVSWKDDQFPNPSIFQDPMPESQGHASKAWRKGASAPATPTGAPAAAAAAGSIGILRKAGLAGFPFSPHSNADAALDASLVTGTDASDLSQMQLSNTADLDGLARGPLQERLFIFVQPAIPQTEKILVEVDGQATVSDLKGRIRAATKIPKSRQLLSTGHRQLLDEDSVSAYGISTRSIVTVTDFTQLAQDKGLDAEPCYIERCEDRGVTLCQLKELMHFVHRHCHQDGLIPSWFDVSPKSFNYQQPLRFDMLDLPQLRHWVIQPLTSSHKCSYSEFVASNAAQQQPLWYISHDWTELLERLIKCMEAHLQARESPPDCSFWLRGLAGERNQGDRHFKAMDETIPVPLGVEGERFVPRRAWCGVLLVLASPDPLPRLAGGKPKKAGRLQGSLMHGQLGAFAPSFSSSLSSSGFMVPTLSRAVSEMGSNVDLGASTGSMFLQSSMSGSLCSQDERGGSLPGRLRYGCDPLGQHGCDECLGAFGDVRTSDGGSRGFLDMAVFASKTALVVTDGPTAMDYKASGVSTSTRTKGNHARVQGSALAAMTVAAWRAKERREAPFPYDIILALLPIITAIPTVTLQHQRVIQFVAATLAMSVWRKCIENYATEEVTAQLSRAVYADIQRPSLRLGFQSVKGFDDAAVKIVAAAVRPNLEELILNFQACNRVTSVGAAMVAEAVAATTLRTLILDFSNCPAISNEGVEKLAVALPKDLRVFRFCLKKSERISDAGAVALAHHLPQSLEVLEIVLEQCGRITDVGVAAMAQRLPPTLQTFWLCLSLCKQVGDASLASLAQGFSRTNSLQHLELEFFGCVELQDAGMLALSKTLPYTLEDVRVDFRRCLRLGEAAVAALLTSLSYSEKLQAINLGFQQTAASRDTVQICRQLAQLREASSSHVQAAQQKVRDFGHKQEVQLAVQPAHALQALGKKGRIIASTPDRLDSWAVRPTLEVDDEDLSDDSWSIPNVNVLTLDFTNCRHIGLAGITALVSKMPQNLRVMKLGFRGCVGLGDADLHALASGLQSSLELLDLDLSCCESITNSGVAALALGIPVTLPDLRASFWCCTDVGDKGVSALAMSLPLMLQRLDLNFGLCSKVTDKGVAAFAKYFPVHIQSCHMYLNATSVSKEKRELFGNIASLHRWRPSDKEVAKPAKAWHPDTAGKEPENKSDDTGIRRHAPSALVDVVDVSTVEAEFGRRSGASFNSTDEPRGSFSGLSSPHAPALP